MEKAPLTVDRKSGALTCLVALVEARKRCNPIQVNPEILPKSSVPTKACYRSAADEGRIIPEVAPIVEPYIGVSIQASGDGSGIYGAQ